VRKAFLIVSDLEQSSATEEKHRSIKEMWRWEEREGDTFDFYNFLDNKNKINGNRS
jgi:hypothetical protein